MEKFSFGQQVFVTVDGQQVRGTIFKIVKNDSGEYVYEVASSNAPTALEGTFREDEIAVAS